MKISIGPYVNWLGPYQLAEYLKYVGVSENKVDKIGDYLASSFFNNWLNKLHEKRKRKIKIKMHNYDSWNAEETLAHIIIPVLKQLRDTTHGYPNDFFTEEDEDGSKGMKEWKDTLNKMIWAFEQCTFDWEDQYYSGEVDFKPIEDKSSIVKGPNHTFKVDREGAKAHEEKMQEGFDLFAKYYKSLWD
jgi:hypothetical protein